MSERCHFIKPPKTGSNESKQQKMLDVAFENAPTIMLLVDSECRVERINRIGIESIGKDPERILGMMAGDIFSCVHAAEDDGCGTTSSCASCPVRTTITNTVSTGSDHYKAEGAIEVFTRNNIVSNRDFIISTVYVDFQNEKKVIVYLDDITERKEAERATIDAMLLAEEANRVKSEFLANMSHELRTPLNSVNGYSEVLLEETTDILDDRHRKFLENISLSGTRLLKLINDILDVSNIESGEIEVNYGEVDVNEVFESVLDDISSLAKKKDIELNVSIVPETFSLYADSFLLRQILLNLSSNAIKFTPDGGNVALKAHLRDNMAEFSVIDTGIGISADDMDKLFIPFHQIDSKLSRKYAGTGLGLSLVKRFVEMQDGEISVESEPGKGSKFMFRLPVNSSNTTPNKHILQSERI
ncbi:PAS domain-containing sensor histidine kinase [Methanolobus zinderi]|uniref:histidine kinase n=1 Tax=Methanolobus zinderi TaxID=536044 RepID=A0A7D5I4G8_9EURY|nr:PAS domain-containing sensor histidine kinase [Methanolobus zinderi]QLC50168.1 PAS domain-containing sensor histidine kinase [Methanolobus zinderi]